jgi:spermidine/putrescine transport system substrate-binding protein
VKRFSILILSFAFAFFCVGLAWGIWSRQQKSQQLANATPLRVLCPEKWLSPKALENFSQRHNVRIQQWTFNTPSEFLRQMANADGKVDLLCTSSLLVRSLIHNHWLKKTDYSALANFRMISTDFTHLPYDPESQYSAPLFWNLYGLFGKEQPPAQMTWKQAWQNHHISLWGEELNILQLMNKLGLNVEQRLQQEDNSREGKALDEEMHKFTKNAVNILKPEQAPFSGEALMLKVDWAQMPLAQAARLLGDSSPYHFFLPEDGATLELGVLAIGEHATQAQLALELINDLLATDAAMQTYQQLNAGVVHASLSGLSSIATLQKPQALRLFPLTRMQFPDLNIEALPRFQRIFDSTLASQN